MGNDLSFNIVALDRASATFIKMAEQVDRLAARLDRLDGKDVTVDVNVKTDKSEAAFGLLDTRFKKLTAGIVAGSAFIGPAILGGIGTGFVGVAALADKSSKDVQDTYKTLWQNVVATTHNATDQLVPQIVGAGRSLDAQLQKLGPDLKKAFAFAGPDIVALSHGVGDLATNVMPGLTASMQQSLPVAESVSIVMGEMGTAVSDTLTSLSQHSAEFGVDVQSIGTITKSALGAATTVVSDLGLAWSQNAGTINSGVGSVSGSISGLANGILPVLSAGLGAVATVVSALGHVLEPLAPVLGFVGSAALATWGAFKLADLASAGVRALAMGVVALGGNMEAGAGKTAVMIAGMRGVEVQASRTATVVRAAGAATATAATGFAAAAESMAGPLGIALAAGTILFSLFSDSEDHAAESAQQLAAATDTMTSAFEASHGAVTASVNDALTSTEQFKKAAVVAAYFGLNQAQLMKIIEQGGPQFDAYRAKVKALSEQLSENAEVSNAIIGPLDGVKQAYDQGKQNAADFAAEQTKVARTTMDSAEVQGVATAAAQSLGLGLGEVQEGFYSVVASGTAASTATGDIAAAFVAAELTIKSAAQAIEDHFISADRAVVQAQTSVDSASHSLAQSSRQVTDARHSEAAAQRALSDAYDGVTQAEQTYVRAQDQERKAQQALSAARQQAIEDLKELHLQLEDQVVSEQQAKVRLFDAQQAAAAVGITADNVQKIASQKVTLENEDQIKQALDLLSAQNALNDTLNSGEKLRKNVTAADKAGVDGSAAVISAQESLRSAHDQVVSAEEGLTRAHQQVKDAAYSLQRAHQAVRDAEYQQARSADQLRIAQGNLKDAEDAASRTLDINTKAGQGNLSLLFSLWDAINKTGLPAQSKFNSMVDDTAKAFGISKQAAQDLLTQIGLIPKDFKYSITAVAGVDFSDAAAILGQARSITGITHHATGGPITGRGGPRDDANLIWASAGEFMQPADAVAHYGPGFMEAVRTKRLRVVGTDGASLAGYADGGLIDAATVLATAGAAYISDVNALTVMALPHPPQLPKYVPPSAFPMFGPPGPGVIPGYIAKAGVAQWAPQILQALSMLGQPASWLATVERRMNQESGGNPTVVNKWDCLTLDALILTRRGWLKHDEVQVGDETIGYNSATGQSEWTVVTKVHHYEDAPLVRIKNSRWQATTTPNHRWVEAKRGGRIRFITTADIRQSSRLLLAAKAATDSRLDVTTTEAAVLGWIAGDGHIERRCPTPAECTPKKDGACSGHGARQNPSISIAQTKPAMVAKLRRLLADVPHRVYVDERRTRTGKKAAGPRHVFRLDYRWAQNLLSRVGHPREAAVSQVLAMSSEHRAAWLEAITDAEGHRAERLGYTKPQVAIYQRPGTVLDAIAIAVYLDGARPRVLHAKRSGHPEWSPEALVRSNVPYLRGQFLSKEEAGRGAVWCVTTALGTWTAQQGEHIFLTGNSNWARGTPSVGLMQVIGPTFRGNAGPFLNTGPFSYGVSVDPLANIYAGLNYAIRRYGSLSALNRPGGYDNGGLLQPGWTAAYVGTGRPENVRTASQEDELLTAVRSVRKENHYTLNAYVTNQGMDVREQFRRMELLQP